MKVIATIDSRNYVCQVSHEELEKFVNKYYGKLEKLDVGEEVNLGAGYDYHAQIENVCRTMKDAMAAFQRAQETLLNFANLVMAVGDDNEKAEQAKRYRELAEYFGEETDVMFHIVRKAGHNAMAQEIATAMRRLAEIESLEPVAYGLPNTMITGAQHSLMQVAIDVPGNDEYGGGPMAAAIPPPRTQGAARMTIQNLIDELRKALPGYHVDLELVPSGGQICATGCEQCGTNETVYMVQSWRANARAKTPDEALALLRQRLGLDREVDKREAMRLAMERATKKAEDCYPPEMVAERQKMVREESIREFNRLVGLEGEK